MLSIPLRVAAEPGGTARDDLETATHGVAGIAGAIDLHDHRRPQCPNRRSAGVAAAPELPLRVLEGDREAESESDTGPIDVT